MTVAKFGALSAAFRDMAQVLFASVFVGPLVSNQSNSFLLANGLILSAVAWFISIVLIKE